MSADRTAAANGTETILFVEDNEALRDMAVRALEKYGYAVLPACDAAEALAIAQRDVNRIDLLITDIAMPGVNGRVMAERLQQSHANLKVVYTSGFTDDSEALQWIRAANLPFVQKPYTLESLAATIRSVLDGP